ncbi:MAG TPA: ATP-binding protein [Casimicrobiaceae bacterium]|nr:ATP-binding protein [Casimicrobiaceae bacterium]
MRRRRFALGIRAQLLLVLSVFLVLPWLGYEYVRELERFLRDAHEKQLAGTAEAIATALHDRPRLFERPAVAPLAAVRGSDDAASTDDAATSGDLARATGSAEIAQILHGLSRTTARIWVIDRDLNVLARAGSLRKRPSPPEPPPSPWGNPWTWLEARALAPLYRLALKQPTDDFAEERAGRTLAQAREVDGALSGILTTDRRPTPDGRATIVTAAYPIWVGDQVRGAVIVEETANAVLAERNRAFERLFNIVIAALLIGSAAVTFYATRLSGRIRALRDDAERAIDPQGRMHARLAASGAGDEIGDLSRSFASVLDRLGQYAAYQKNMASRLSHELRTPVAVVRSSLENLQAQPLAQDARVYLERAQSGLSRLTEILTRMTEATRLEQSLHEAERERVDLVPLVAGCVDGYRSAYSGFTFAFHAPDASLVVDAAPDLIAQMLDKLVVNATEFALGGSTIDVRLQSAGSEARLSVSNAGPLLPEDMRSRLFDSMVSVRSERGGDVPHLGLGLYIVRLIAEFHGGRAFADNRPDASGVTITVVLPRVDGA